MAMMPGANVFEGVLNGEERFALKRSANELNDRHGQVREVGEGTILDLPILAVALSEENSGRRVSIGDGGDIHDYV
jgi:hypothetical protein